MIKFNEGRWKSKFGIVSFDERLVSEYRIFKLGKGREKFEVLVAMNFCLTEFIDTFIIISILLTQPLNFVF